MNINSFPEQAKASTFYNSQSSWCTHGGNSFKELSPNLFFFRTGFPYKGENPIAIKQICSIDG